MKPRRDITLGEMQDECKRVDGNCGNCNKAINEVCDKILGKPLDPQTPIEWNLTDPPRFTEAQMAFLRGLYGVGICKLEIGTREQWQVYAYNEIGTVLHFNSVLIGITEDEYETLDLAELLGKDGADGA